MRKNLWFAFALLAAFGLAGCSAGDRASCLWDSFPSITGMLKCILLDRSFGDVFIEKYVPTSLIWWALAIISLWLPMRSMKYWKWDAYVGLVFLFFSGIAFIYTALNGIAFLGVGILFAMGSAIIAPIVLLATKALAVAKVVKGAAQLTADQIKKADESAKAAKSQGGVEAETSFEAKMVPIMVLGLLGTVFVVAVLFGGEVSSAPPKQVSIIDLILRVVGCLLAAASFGFILYDAKHCHWLCTHCERLVWDHGSNKATCPLCQYPNPREDLIWICEKCKWANLGPKLKCVECGTVRTGCKQFVPAPSWKCPGCGATVLNEKSSCACGYLNPGPKWTCNKTQDGELCGQENSGSSLFCEACGKPRKGVLQKFLRSALEAQDIEEPEELPPGPEPMLALPPHDTDDPADDPSDTPSGDDGGPVLI